MQLAPLLLPFLAVAHGYQLAAPRVPATHAPSRAGVVRASENSGPLLPDVWSKSPSVRVQGNTLKTWNIGVETIERVQLSVKSEGRPIDANIELWQTPSYTPTKFRVYTEDGKLRPVDAIIETPLHPKTVAVYNKASVDFPFDATVVKSGLASAHDSLLATTPEHVQGGMITSYTFGPEVKSVQILMKSDERNMKAKVELTQGPNQVKQFIEMYASKGYKNPFYAVIQTPGAYSTIRVINQNTVEFPFDAWVLPYETGDEAAAVDMSAGGGWGR